MQLSPDTSISKGDRSSGSEGTCNSFVTTNYYFYFTSLLLYKEQKTLYSLISSQFPLLLPVGFRLLEHT